jgi:hypothetical protein
MAEVDPRAKPGATAAVAELSVKSLARKKADDLILKHRADYE